MLGVNWDELQISVRLHSKVLYTVYDCMHCPFLYSFIHTYVYLLLHQSQYELMRAAQDVDESHISILEPIRAEADVDPDSGRTLRVQELRVTADALHFFRPIACSAMEMELLYFLQFCMRRPLEA